MTWSLRIPGGLYKTWFVKFKSRWIRTVAAQRALPSGASALHSIPLVVQSSFSAQDNWQGHQLSSGTFVPFPRPPKDIRWKVFSLSFILIKSCGACVTYTCGPSNHWRPFLCFQGISDHLKSIFMKLVIFVLSRDGDNTEVDGIVRGETANREFPEFRLQFHCIYIRMTIILAVLSAQPLIVLSFSLARKVTTRRNFCFPFDSSSSTFVWWVRSKFKALRIVTLLRSDSNPGGKTRHSIYYLKK